MPKLILYLILSEIFIAGFYNLINPRLPKIPGDIYIDKSVSLGFRVYIPFVSAIILSIILYFGVPALLPAAADH